MSARTGVPVASITFTCVIARIDSCPVRTEVAAIKKTINKIERTIILNIEHLARWRILLTPERNYNFRKHSCWHGPRHDYQIGDLIGAIGGLRPTYYKGPVRIQKMLVGPPGFDPGTNGL